ncbi:hypothetical protein LXA43DRAFT_305581 [Ganoderma leucocontextum]|nr:hypothetical protein LXA43DRAFT_305581 [Ganoderma leucocontextum]
MSWLNRKPVFKVPDGCGIGMIHLARLLDMPTLLPVAFYNATLVRGDVVNGWSLEDGTRRYLEPNDLRRFIEGYATLRRKAECMHARVFDTRPSKDCSGIDCDEVLPKIILARHRAVSEGSFPFETMGLGLLMHQVLYLRRVRGCAQSMLQD